MWTGGPGGATGRSGRAGARVDPHGRLMNVALEAAASGQLVISAGSPCAQRDRGVEPNH